MKNIALTVAESCLKKAGIPPSSDRMEKISVSYKCNNKFTKKCLYSSDLLYRSVPLVVSSPLAYKQPLDGSSKRLFQWLIHSKDSDNLKQQLNMK